MAKSKLESLYKAAEGLKDLDLKSKTVVLEEIVKLEEALIKEDILPILQERIDPVLRQIKRPLVLVVDYDPELQTTKLRLSHGSDAQSISEAKVIETDPEVEHRTNEIKKKGIKKAPMTNVRVKYPDGTVLENVYAWHTLRDVILRTGIQRVRDLDIVICGVKLISNRVDKKYAKQQKDLGDGWLMMTNCSTETIRKQIMHISNSYGLGLKVEVFERVKKSDLAK